ncbi:MAG: hypothetical protein K2K77_00290 [Duncaniella sp.]|nr:hypothetical protein [Duncaniella sp.]
MSITASAQGTYQYDSETAVPAGTTVDAVPNCTLTFGAAGDAEFKAAKPDTHIEGFTHFCEGNGGNPKVTDGVIVSGTAYELKPALDGTITVGVILNANKSFYVIQDGTALPAYDGLRVDEKAYTTYSFDVTGGKTYIVYCAGSKLGFYGFTYETNETEPNGVLMSWDFTKWSDATVANLKAGEDWSDIEKADGTNPTDGNCFWQVSATADLNAEKYLMANDVVIEELKGLVYTNEKANRSLAIAVNYPETSLGTYHGPAYLWLGSKNINYFVIPAVPAGATIKMGVESHKTTDARGVTLSIAGETLNAPDGSAVAAPTTYTEQEWLVPATAAATNDVQITNTNGCHIYFITVTAEDTTTAISEIASDENAPVEYYNLQGIRVAEPSNGIFIKRQGNKVQKVLVK